MKSFALKILTPERTAFDGIVECLTVTDVNGLVTVLSGHAPMVSVLAPGPLMLLTYGKKRMGQTSAGLLHVTREKTAVIVGSFEWDAEPKE